MAKYGLMGPAWQAMNTCFSKMKVLVVMNQLFRSFKWFEKLNNQIEIIHEFVYECPLLVKNAVDFINKDDVRQGYRKLGVQILFPFQSVN